MKISSVAAVKAKRDHEQSELRITQIAKKKRDTEDASKVAIT